MKAKVEEYGYITIQLTAKDIASLINMFSPENDDEIEAMMDAIVKNFPKMGVGVRQDLVKKVVAKHFSKQAAKKVLDLIDSFDVGVYEERRGGMASRTCAARGV